MLTKLKAHWHKIGLARKIIEIMVAVMLLLSTSPSLAVRFSILNDAEPAVAVSCHPKYDPDSATILPGTAIGKWVFPTYTIYPQRYTGFFHEDTGTSIVDFQIYRILIFNVALPQVSPGP
ncbi:hypothetical protein [Levilactobacillus sp. 244-2]|uniref:hypothetical protein n=1 Tax=Levilactobacillus sp. 244-2 TaxID=2799569 RepID=UPI00194E94CD|nr:hypothetical protein [Levilactobacillus sp. 244-2]